MTFVKYIDKKFQSGSLSLIEHANSIIEEYNEAISVRQLYYQFVARELIPNNAASYNRLQSLISDGRMAGLISWNAIEDRGRNLMGLTTYKTPKEAIKTTRDKYKKDLWKDQRFRPEVWVEKQALEGVVGHICNELRVDFFATRGYNSQSEQWTAGRRFGSYIMRGQTPIVLHLGDHDPSGIDMTRDNQERLSLFAGVPISVVRIALNMDQIEELDLPPNPVKLTDLRASEYQRVYDTDSSWELDALSPTQIQNIIAEAVAGFRDESLWQQALDEEARDINEMDMIMEDLS